MARTVSGTNSIRAQATAQDQSRAVLFEQLRQGCAELVGTFALIYVGVLVLTAGGAALFASGFKDLVAVALAHGFIIAVMVSATMNISGGQLNPAVTAGLLATGRISPLQAGINVLAQLLGGVLTFFLVSAVFGTVIDDRFGGRMGGLAIGLSVALGVLAGGPLTGAAMNPARWFGPALAQGTYPNPLVFILGPLVGGVLAGLLWHYVLLPRRR